MATASSTNSNDLDTECPVCHDDFCEPKLLPCNHMACKKCLLTWLGNAKGKVGCPLCRTPILTSSCSGQGDLHVLVDSFPTNLAVVALVEGRRVLSSRHVCAMCQNNVTATSFCFPCDVKLCRACTKYHAKLPGTRHHRVEQLSKLTATQLTSHYKLRCKTHSDRLAELFCPAHKEVICTLCSNTVHEQCTGKTNISDDVIEETRGDLQHRASALREEEQVIASQIQDVNAKPDAVRKKVKDTFDDLHVLVEKKRKEAEQQIQTQENVTMTSLKALETSRASLGANARTVEELIRTAPGSALLGMVSDLNVRVDQLQSQTAEVTGSLVPVVEFSVEVEKMKQLREDIASLDVVHVKPTSLRTNKSSVAPSTTSPLTSQPTSSWAGSQSTVSGRVLKVGDRVKPAGRWAYLAGGRGAAGTVTSTPSRIASALGLDTQGQGCWVDILWDNGYQDCYRVGCNDEWFQVL